jgi:hypothetical protein
LLFAAAGGVFAVDESSTDYYSSFITNFQINFTSSNITNFTIAQDLETLEIKFYRYCIYNGEPTDYATVKLLTCRHNSIILSSKLHFKKADGKNGGTISLAHTLVLHDKRTDNLTSPDYIIKPRNGALDNIRTIQMHGSYVVNSQYDITPAQAKFRRGVHTSVNMSYTWTLRNFTLPLIATTSVFSAVFFVGLGAAEFNMEIMPETKGNDFMSIQSGLKTAPEHIIQFPFQVNYTYELIDNACGLVENAILDRNTGLMSWDYRSDVMSSLQVFSYSNVKLLSKKHQCVTIKYRVVYDVVSNITLV